MFARMCSFGIVASILFQTSVPAAAADTAALPDAASLRTRVAAAEGTPPERERVTESYTAHGLTGTTVIVRVGKNARKNDVAGPFSTAAGTYNGQAWFQNANGETVLEQPERTGVDVEPTTTTVSRIATPFDAYVIGVVNIRGEGTKTYVDPGTYRILRRDRITATDTTVTLYDDFRKSNGFERPWHWTIRDGYPENDAEYRVLSTDVSAAEADVRIPPNRRIVVEFPGAKNTVELPVKEYGAQFIVRVQIGSRGYDFVLDSGSSGIAMDDDVVRQLGLKRYGAYSNPANAGRYSETPAIVPELAVGDLKMHDVAIRAIPHLGSGYDGVYKAVGLLGFDFIGDVALSLDYVHGRVMATTPEAFTAPKDAHTFAVPLRFDRGEPMTEVAVNGVPGERFAIDTGWSGSNMAVFDYFARRHPEAMRGAVYLASRKRFMGVGGEVATTPYRFDSVKVGNVVFKDFIAERVASTKQYAGDDGVIGVGFLQLFTVYLDYANSMMYLVPNGRRDTGAA